MHDKRLSVVDSSAAVDIWTAGVEAADAEKVVGNSIRWSDASLVIAGESFEIERLKRIIVIGFGKCSGAMAAGFETAVKDLPNIDSSGLVIVPAGQPAATARIATVIGRSKANNFPTAIVVDQTQHMLEMITGAGEDTLIIAMVSGGGSALLEKPLVQLDDLISVSRSLSSCGASIESLNTVRRALSGIKAGGLARHVVDHSNAKMIGLIICDVIGDELGMVASGPTVFAEQSVAQLRSDARRVMLEFDLQDKFDSIYRWLGQAAESTRPSNSSGRTKNVLIANNTTAADAADSRARELSFKVVSNDAININQDVNDVAEAWVELATKAMDGYLPKDSSAQLTADKRLAGGAIAIVAGGEPTVVLCNSPGCGGRNSQTAALVLQKLLISWPVDRVAIAFLAGGTDGEDGSAAAAGAFFDTETLRGLRKSPSVQNELKKAILENDCDSFFASHGNQLSPPSVSTNVCDLQVMLVGGFDEET